MATSFPQRSAGPRIVFLTRDPVFHQQSGSTTYVVGLLALLRAQGAEITVVATVAYSRSPRLFFRQVVPVPDGVQLRYPGYLRIGSLYVSPLRLKAWARMLSRAAVRWPWLRWISRDVQRLFGGGLYTGAWDLTAPAPLECEAAHRAIEEADASTVIANYCMWGPLLRDGRVGQRKTAILMHDLLSARVQRFQQSGAPLDMPLITHEEEMHWLSSADTVLAAQDAEAEEIRASVGNKVLVAPIVLQARALAAELVVAGRCLFVGSNIAPNRTGLEFLLEAVWPRVRQEMPGATLAIAGTVGRALQAQGHETMLSSLGIEVLGVVNDLEAEYARAAVCVVPLVLGTGIKIKLLEALAFGKAIVSTGVGIQGLEAWAHQAVEVGDDAESFAAAIVRLLSDESLRAEREAGALRAAEERFGSKQSLDPQFVQALL